MAKWIYITVENFNREAHAKLLLAFYGIKQNYNVVLGEKNLLRQILTNFPKGTIIEKSLGPNLVYQMKEWKKYGHKIVGLDEEALTYFSDKQYFNLNIAKNVQKFADRLFLLGKRHEKTIKKKVPRKIYKIVGNPRYDIFNKRFKSIFSEDVKEIKKKHGKFILITSRFGNVNLNRTSIGHVLKLLDRKYQEQSILLSKKFEEMILFLAKNVKNYKIILRPHPSESLEFWKKKLSMYKNCDVIYEKNVAPWILASEAMIQNRCTTGVESFLLGKKTISFDPLVNLDPHKKLFIDLSFMAKDKYSVLKYLKKNVKKKKKIQTLKQYIHLNNKIPASKKIIDEIDKITPLTNKNVNFFDLIKLKAFFIRNKIMNIILSLKSKEFKKYLFYTNQKKGKINKKEIFKILNTYSNKISKNTNFYHKQLSENIHLFKS